MTRVPILAMLAALTTLGLQNPPENVPGATFNREVLPILENNCQTCHRTGGIAPMPLVTYADTRPWAKAIKAKVLNKQMPPWFADPGFKALRNAPQLTEADIRTIAAWADAGAPEGNPADGQRWVEGWRTRPDVVVPMENAHKVGATGPGEIRHFSIPSPFKEDTWVSSIEIRPGDPSVVHHAILHMGENMPPQGVRTSNEINADGSPGVERSLPTSGYGGPFLSGPGTFMTMEAVYAPGSQPLNFSYMNSAKRIPGGKQLVLEVHYTPNGKATSDRTMIGFTLAKNQPARQFVLMAPEHLGDTRKPIPAKAANWKTRGEIKFKQDVDLVWFMPHMHLRGKDMTFELIYPDGKRETVLSASFNFHWQLGYELQTPIRARKGTRMVVTAHHDNSANNRDNPEPNKPVEWGDLTSQEMMLPWFGVIVSGDSAPEAIAKYKQKGFDPVGIIE